ncbi:hypothetical protein KEM55_006430 [Ascosphaera atra]|nr:hypothetical protein KEM55_006430 [Ascosphaera atra]
MALGVDPLHLLHLAVTPSANPPSSQLPALIAIKRNLIGQTPRKQAWVERGILPVLGRIIDRCREDLSFTDGVAAQSVIIAGLIANGGPPFVHPIVEAHLIPSILSMLAYPVQALRRAVLETINRIADNLPLDYHRSWAPGKELADVAFSPNYLPSFVEILNSNNPKFFKLAAAFITKACISEQHKMQLATSGVLDALTLKVAQFVVTAGMVLPGAEAYLDKPGALGKLPEPTQDDVSVMTAAVRAIHSVVDEKPCLVDHLLSSPPIVTVFPQEACGTSTSGYHVVPSADKKLPWGVVPRPSTRESRYPNPIDALLPPFKFEEPPTSFPSLAAATQAAEDLTREQVDGRARMNAWESREESPLVSYLFYIAWKTTDSQELRLAAIKLLTSLFSLRLVKEHRVPMMVGLLMPILLRMTEGVFPSTLCPSDDGGDDGADFTSYRETLKIEAVCAMAALMKNIKERRKSHNFVQYEQYAVEMIIAGLKRTFTVHKHLARPMWDPAGGDAADEKSKKDEEEMRAREAEKAKEAPVPRERTLYPTYADFTLSPPGKPYPSTRLGPKGLSPFVAFQLRTREKYLLALTGLALYDEENRQQFAAKDVLKCILASLQLPPDQSEEQVETSQQQAGQQDDKAQEEQEEQKKPQAYAEQVQKELEYNTVSCVYAACNAARALCRSPRLVRTTLKDAHLEQSAKKLLPHEDLDIKLAATSTICNLTLNFSPMKKFFLEETVIKQLCVYAQSPCLKLRLEALWALKHCVLNEAEDIQMMILRHLGLATLMENFELESREHISVREDNNAPLSDITNILSFVEHLEPDKEYPPEPIPLSLWAGEPRRPGLAAYIKQLNRAERLQLSDNLAYLKKVRKERQEVIEQAVDILRNLICGSAGTKMAEVILGNAVSEHEQQQRQLLRQQHGQQERAWQSPLRLQQPDQLYLTPNAERIYAMFMRRMRYYDVTVTVRKGVSPFAPAPEQEGKADDLARYTCSIAPSEQLLTAITYALNNISASSWRHGAQMFAQDELLSLIIAYLSHDLARVRCNAAFIVVNFISKGLEEDPNGCKVRAHNLRSAGVFKRLKRMAMEDPDVDVRQRALDAANQLSGLAALARREGEEEYNKRYIY